MRSTSWPPSAAAPLSPPAGATPPYQHDYQLANVRANVEQSLRRLGTDWLDLVQVHMSPSRAQLEADQTIPVLQALREEGKVRFIGMSGILPHLTDHIAMGVFDVFQVPYSALQREHEELINAAAAAGAGRSSAAGQRAAPRPRTSLAIAEQGPLPADRYEEARRRLAPPAG